MIRSATALVALFAATSAMAETAAQTRIFVGCPVLRNTTLPCWMGISGGELYYLGPQGDLGADFYPPEFEHKMLVEGTISSEAKICGGVVLKPVKVSVLPDVDEACNVMLPAEGYPDPPNNRGSGPSGVRGGQAPAPPPRRPPPPLNPPFRATTFNATFNADSDRMWRPAQSAISEAARLAIAARASEVQVIGYRSSIRMSDGQNFVERESVAESRAKVVEVALRTLGVPETTRIKVSWRQSPSRSDGIQADIEARKVSILVVP
jgi:outer membrane protein OmpA-like peptidoglycan-associated protein